MKKKLLIAACSLLTLAAVSALLFAVESSKSSVILSSRSEALTDCEIKGPHGSVAFSCSGEGTCSATKMGYTLTCDGTKN